MSAFFFFNYEKINHNDQLAGRLFRKYGNSSAI